MTHKNRARQEFARHLATVTGSPTEATIPDLPVKETPNKRQ